MFGGDRAAGGGCSLKDEEEPVNVSARTMPPGLDFVGEKHWIAGQVSGISFPTAITAHRSP